MPPLKYNWVSSIALKKSFKFVFIVWGRIVYMWIHGSPASQYIYIYGEKYSLNYNEIHVSLTVINKTLTIVKYTEKGIPGIIKSVFQSQVGLGSLSLSNITNATSHSPVDSKHTDMFILMTYCSSPRRSSAIKLKYVKPFCEEENS